MYTRKKKWGISVNIYKRRRVEYYCFSKKKISRESAKCIQRDPKVIQDPKQSVLIALGLKELNNYSDKCF